MTAAGLAVPKRRRPTKAQRKRTEDLLLLGWRIAGLYVVVLSGVSAMVSGVRGLIVHTTFPPGVIVFLLVCLVLGGIANLVVAVLTARIPRPRVYLLRPVFMTYMGTIVAGFGGAMIAYGVVWPPGLPIAIVGTALLVIALLVSASRFFIRSPA